MTRNLLDELKHLLRQDFTAANLDRAINLAFDSSWNAPSPLGLFVVTRVLRILADQWDVPDLGDEAWMTQPALMDMEERLRPPLMDYLSAADDGLDADAELQLLDAIVRALFKWTAERPHPRPVL